MLFVISFYTTGGNTVKFNGTPSPSRSVLLKGIKA